MVLQAENKDEREEDGQEEQNQKKRPARDRQREAMESGSISHAKLQASKLVSCTACGVQFLKNF